MIEINRHKRELSQLGLEGRVDGVAEQEIEYEFYGRIEDINKIISLATQTEYQEQYELKKERGKIRVRMSRVGDVTVYTMTSKTWTPGKAGEAEVEVEVSEDMFAHFRHIADSGMIKTRYSIPAGSQRLSGGDIEKLTWEYDVFQDRDGKRSEWVKVDLEVKEVLATLPELPVALSDVIKNQKGSRTPKEIRTLDRLFKEEFLVEAGPGNVDQTVEPPKVGTEGIADWLFGSKKVKIRTPKLYSPENVQDNFEHFRSLLKSGDFEVKPKELTEKHVLALTMEGRKEISPTISASAIEKSINSYAPKVMRYLKEVESYSASVDSFFEDVGVPDITLEVLKTRVAKLKKEYNKVLKTFPSPIDVIGGITLTVKNGAVVSQVAHSKVKSIMTPDTAEEILKLMDLYDALMKDEYDRLPLMNCDTTYSDFHYPAALDEILDNNQDMSDALGELTYHQNVKRCLETEPSETMFGLMYGLQKVINAAMT